MSQIENPMVAGLGRFYAHQDRELSLAIAAFESLQSDMVGALTDDPTRSVQTPAWRLLGSAPAFEVIDDSFAETNGDDSLIELLRIVGAMSRGEDCQLRASAWIAAVSNEYAMRHRDELAEMLGDDA